MNNSDDNRGQPPRRSRFNFSNARFSPPEPAPTPAPRNTEREVRRTVRHHNRTAYSVADKNGPLVFNVSQLMRSPEGATRAYDVKADKLVLYEEGEAAATNINGHVRLTRVAHDILAQGAFEVDSVVNCVRCLNDFSTHINFELEDIYRPSIDVITGLPVEDDTDPDNEKLVIDENHLLDLGEALRQQILVSLPMFPVCGDDCPGLYQELQRINADTEPEEVEESSQPVDKRWAALKNLHLDE